MPKGRGPITPEYEVAFAQAVGAYEIWARLGLPLRKVQMDHQFFDVETVCSVVELCDGTMPDDLYDCLCKLAHRNTGGTEAPPVDQTYAAGARCLRALVVYKNQIDKNLGRD